MRRRLVLSAAAVACLALGGGGASAQTEAPKRVPKAEKVKALKLGSGTAGYGVSQKDYTFDVGKRYSWEISSEGKHECDLESDFFATLDVEKVEIENVALERPKIAEIEFGEDEGEIEIVFTPTKAGEYAWSCKGLEGRGMMGKFVVK